MIYNIAYLNQTAYMQVLFLVGQMSKHHLCTEGNAQKIQVAWVEVVQNVFNYEKNFSNAAIFTFHH